MTRAIERLDAKIVALEKKLEPLKLERSKIYDAELKKRSKREILVGIPRDHGLEVHYINGLNDFIVAKPGTLFEEIVDLTPQIIRRRIIRIDGGDETIIAEWCYPL